MRHALILFALFTIPCGPVFAAEAKRPNILFILVDDQSPFDLKCYNPQSPLETPHIDRLAREGMVFDGAYHMGSFSGAVCTPSRHMIMCGRTVWHLPIAPQAMQNGRCPPNLEQQTIPAVFNRAGYATMRTCKQGNSYEAANKLFTVRHDATKRGGTPETGSVWHGDRVMDYLQQREAAKDAKPFLIYFGFSHPHDERDGTPELLAKYGAVNHTDKSAPPPTNPKQPKLPPNYLPAHPFHHCHPGLRDEVAVSGVWERRDGRKQTVRDVLYGVYNGGTKPGMRSVKHGDWKLIKYDVMKGEVRETQLFNFRDNPDEFLAEHHDAKVTSLTGTSPASHQVNLASDPKHAAKLAEMEALLLAEMRRLHDPWRLWNQPADGLTPPPDGPLSGQGKGKKKKQ